VEYEFQVIEEVDDVAAEVEDLPEIENLLSW
jgi:hypothetical protein